MSIERWRVCEVRLEQLRQCVPNSEYYRPNTTDVSSETQAVNDRDRCPKSSDLGVNKQLFADAGYFLFGQIPLVCARLLEWVHPDLIFLVDAIADVSMDDGRLSFPFNPTEIIEIFAWNDMRTE